MTDRQKRAKGSFQRQPCRRGALGGDRAPTVPGHLHPTQGPPGLALSGDVHRSAASLGPSALMTPNSDPSPVGPVASGPDTWVLGTRMPLHDVMTPHNKQKQSDSTLTTTAPLQIRRLRRGDGSDFPVTGGSPSSTAVPASKYRCPLWEPSSCPEKPLSEIINSCEDFEAQPNYICPQTSDGLLAPRREHQSEANSDTPHHPLDLQRGGALD